MTDLPEGARLALMNWPGDGGAVVLARSLSGAAIARASWLDDEGLATFNLLPGGVHVRLTPAGIAKRAELLREAENCEPADDDDDDMQECEVCGEPHPSCFLEDGMCDQCVERGDYD